MLTNEQHQEWYQNGYLLVKAVLSQEHVDNYTRIVDDTYERHLVEPQIPKLAAYNDQTPDNHLHAYNLIAINPVFIELIDFSITFPFILDIMGENIILTQSQALVRAYHPDDRGLLHRDGGAMAAITLNPHSKPLQIKIQYALTDVTSENSGNFVLEPGSHNYRQSHKTQQLKLNAGDALIFHSALRHGYVPNRSRHPRKSLVFGYGQQFMKPLDYQRQTESTLSQCTPRQRRLLGNIGGWRIGSYYYPPANQREMMTPDLVSV